MNQHPQKANQAEIDKLIRGAQALAAGEALDLSHEDTLKMLAKDAVKYVKDSKIRY